MPAALQLAGQRFGRLVVTARCGKDRDGAWTWTCRCDCGRLTTVRGATLKRGKTSACASCAASRTTHGQSDSALYRRWRAMLDRTQNPNNSAWQNYGGRGIGVCHAWHDFSAFACDMGDDFSPDLELDRINVEGDYEPGNCRWATRATQQNNRRNNHRITWSGETHTVQEWADLRGVNANTLLYRIRRGWDLDRAMSASSTNA